MTCSLFPSTMPRVAAACLLSLLGSAAGAGTTLEGWQAASAVESNDPNFGRSTTSDYASGFGGKPVSLSLHVSRGGGLSDSQIAFDDTGVHSSWVHTMAPGHDDAEPRTDYIFEFRVDQDSTYALTGAYEAIGSTRMSAIIDLWDRQTSQRLFKQQIDGTTTDPSLTIGQDPSWPWYHTLVGSTTGMLEAGKKYRLDLDVFLRQSGGNAGALGEGSFNLDISPIPAPGSLAALGAGALALSRRRR